MGTFKAELKKLLTVRSTYILSGFLLLLTVAVAFYVHGYMQKGVINDKLFLAATVTQVGSSLSVVGAILGLLLLSHEYRYNTIVYTLTFSNRRSKVLISKIAAIFLYVFVFVLVGALLSLLAIKLGVVLSGRTMPPQDINYVTYLAKIIFFCESFALAGLLFATLIRNQIGAIAALFILPNTIEGLLSLLLKHNSVYLPFTALGQVIQPTSLPPPNVNESPMGYLTPAKAALVFFIYLAIGWCVAWYLFLKRDAN
jgi:ABC-2 type transport system permease protein